MKSPRKPIRPRAGHDKFQGRSPGAGHAHVLHFTPPLTQTLHAATDGIFRHIQHHELIGLTGVTVHFSINHLRLRDLELIAFAAHIFNQNAQVQFTPTGDGEAIGGISRLDPQRNVGFEFPHEAIAQLSGGDKLALLAGKGRVIDRKGHA
jgi:hypothetical protein